MVVVINLFARRSDDENSFVLVHNGIITNYKDVKQFLVQKGHTFESETDTEVIAKLLGHIFDEQARKGKEPGDRENGTFQPAIGFRELVEQAIMQLVTTCKFNNFNKT